MYYDIILLIIFFSQVAPTLISRNVFYFFRSSRLLLFPTNLIHQKIFFLNIYIPHVPYYSSSKMLSSVLHNSKIILFIICLSFRMTEDFAFLVALKSCKLLQSCYGCIMNRTGCMSLYSTVLHIYTNRHLPFPEQFSW